MPFSFEVTDTDLLGRIGRLTVGGRRLETPYLFPVVHPVRQTVPLDVLKGMGFNGLMTNSYILYTRRKEEATAKGLRSLLGYDGVLMTDSGGYQVLEYGGLDVTYGQIAGFQEAIGSDLAVTLDRPTGYSLSRRYSRETMAYSLENAAATMKEFGEAGTTWVGPVQGGLFADILRESVRGLTKAGFRFLALGSPTQVMQNYRFSELVGMISATRSAMDYSVPLHLFGAGHPLTMAMAVALGCDTFDSASYILFARQGRYMTDLGVQKVERLAYLPCNCPVCNGTTAKELGEMERAEAVNRLALHNLHMLRKEIQACKESIAEGRLWDLVEARATAHPALFKAFSAFAEHSKPMEAGTPALKERGLLLRGESDSRRPEVSIAAERLEVAMRRRGRRASLLLSKDQAAGGSGSRARPSEGSDRFRVHAALGAYPAELEFVYPFTQTVASEAGLTPADVKAAVSRLKELGYTKVEVVVADRQARSKAVKSRPRRTGASPSPQSASSRTRSPRRRV